MGVFMPTVNLREAANNLSELIEAAARGESVIIARDGKPAAQLTAIQETRRSWSPAVHAWFEEGEGLQLEHSREDLAPVRERDLF
jgi:prevent-host-death family protein